MTVKYLRNAANTPVTLLATGAVISGEVTISIADVDLIYISLRALISSVRAGEPQ